MERSTVFLFAYGSIQPGSYNYREGLCVGESFPGTVHGRIYFAYRGGYPVAKLVHGGRPVEKGDIQVHGTWMEVDPDSPVYQGVVRMEEGAGYRLVMVQDSETLMKGFAFHYEYQVNPKFKITSGNWQEETDFSSLHD